MKSNAYVAEKLCHFKKVRPSLSHVEGRKLAAVTSPEETALENRKKNPPSSPLLLFILF